VPASFCGFTNEKDVVNLNDVMIVTFRLRYSTHVGQSIWFSGDSSLPERPVPMHFLDREFWETTITLDSTKAGQPLRYSYTLHNPDGSQVTDWGRDRSMRPSDFNAHELLVIDSWNSAGFIANAFYTAPFRNVLLAKHFTEVPAAKTPDATHTFRVKSPLLPRGQVLCLLGEGEVLGNWQTNRPILLHRAAGEDHFAVQIDLRGQTFPLAYKYGVFDVENNSFIRYEDGNNRILNDTVAPGKQTIVNDGFTVLPTDTWHGAGVAVPVFSLRSEQSFGVGEFLDLKPLADWGRTVGLKMIQLLPINDTTATHTWKDSYPYAAISAFALHPIYLNLATVAGAKNTRLLEALESERRRLNALDTLDYEAVMKLKLDFLRKIFPFQKDATFRRREYKAFFAATNIGSCLMQRFVICATNSARRISAAGRSKTLFSRKKLRRW
jgi:4-alpha-glucanotransferase